MLGTIPTASVPALVARRQPDVDSVGTHCVGLGIIARPGVPSSHPQLGE